MVVLLNYRKSNTSTKPHHSQNSQLYLRREPCLLFQHPVSEFLNKVSRAHHFDRTGVRHTGLRSESGPDLERGIAD